MSKNINLLGRIRKLNIISSELFHDNPKLKPPRFDLRKRKVMDDPDFNDVDIDQDDTYDEDLSEEPI